MVLILSRGKNDQVPQTKGNKEGRENPLLEKPHDKTGDDILRDKRGKGKVRTQGLSTKRAIAKLLDFKKEERQREG